MSLRDTVWNLQDRSKLTEEECDAHVSRAGLGGISQVSCADDHLGWLDGSCTAL